MSDVPKSLNGLENMFNEWFVTKAPFQIPANARETIVKLSPWLTLVLVILFLPVAFAIFGLGSLVGSVARAAGVSVGPFYYLAFIVLLAQLVVMAISIPKLFKRQRSGWKLVYYSSLFNVVYDLFVWLQHPGQVISLLMSLISAAIGLYILFQIRGYYN